MRSVKGEGISVGAFIRVSSSPHAEWGVGKVTRLHGKEVAVSYFDVPDDPRPTEVVVPIAAVNVVDLPEQTRVFQIDKENSRWRVGRVLDGAGQTVLVQFPNQQIVNAPREELHTRWRRPIADPVAFLIRQVNETPLFAEARAAFVRTVILQRGASLGMGAILSSSIQLADYQFSVVRRVLQDTVQRYLLADEVGLGKTIEAGILIRQYVLDQPKTARVLVIAPPPLVSQWKRELAERFNLAVWLDDFVHVVDSNDLGSIEEYIERAGMLVVDEAHHLSRVGDDGVNRLYDLLTANAKRVSRLLLLSATPVLSDAAGFLRVLHLLDPVVFSLDDKSGFERRLQARQLVAETVAALVPENVLSMEGDLDRLQDQFPSDMTLGRAIANLRPIVQLMPHEDDEPFLRALGELRSHLVETYKLHRRILRNRRKSVPWATPRRTGVEVVEYECEATAERRRALESLRVRLANIDVVGDVHNTLFGAAVHGAYAPVMYSALCKHGVQDLQALELARMVDELTLEVNREGARLQTVVAVVKRLLESLGQQVVVFCDREQDADEITAELQLKLPEAVVQRHEVSSQQNAEDDGHEPWELFLSEPLRCRVLVCDFRAEEGLNLHGGKKVAVHYDLPPAPNRIEQRLGRLDRFGAGDAIKSVVVACRHNLDEVAWLACLKEGLQVFSASIASLQYLIEETLRATCESWAAEGEPAIQRWREQLAGASGWVARESRRIEQQDALDALGEAHDNAFDHLEAVDSEWQTWRESFDGFAIEALKFHKRTERWDAALTPGDQVFRLAYVRPPQGATLMTLRAFVAEFLDTLDIDAAHSSSKNPLTAAYAFRRNTAVSKQGYARGVRPLRFGDSLVDALYSFCESDDRGRVFAMWRHMPSYSPRDASGVDLFFRFDFLIEADLSSDGQMDEDELRALRRRIDGHFPAIFQSVWVLPDRRCVDVAPPALQTPYSKKVGMTVDELGRDYNLNASRWQVLNMAADIPWTTAWSEHCIGAETAAREFVMQLDQIKYLIRRGIEGFRQQHAARTAQLRARASRLFAAARDAELAELLAEDRLHARLISAIGSPRLRLDAVGAVFVAPMSPFRR